MTPARASHADIAKLFLKLGLTAFGGPSAHIAMMENEVVRKKKWLTEEQFLDLMGATNLIPGPNSTEMAIHIGHAKGGWPGLVIAGMCFIIPAVVIVLACAWLYVTYGLLPAAQGVLYGLKPVIVAIIVQAVWNLGAKTLKTKKLIFIFAVVLGLNILGVNELMLLGVGALMAILLNARSLKATVQGAATAESTSYFEVSRTLFAGAGATTGMAFSYSHLFWFFLKTGSVLYGSGYVLISFLRADLVNKWGWLTESQLLDAVAVGQFTPGPVFTTATFIGYILGGTQGAMLATIAIFIPAFVFVAISGPLVPRLRKNKWSATVLDGINMASLALMLAAAVFLSRSAMVDFTTLVLFFVSIFMLIRFKMNSVWPMLMGAITGYLLI